MHLVVGLGNPGKKYETTRHNFGRIVLESFSEDMGLSWEYHTSGNDIAITKLNGSKTILCLPQTFMNESGVAVQKLSKFYKIKSSAIIVIYDDIDLPFTTIRVSRNTSAGGHNGIKSILERVNAPDFHRIRLGIGPQTSPAEKFVLEKFTKEEVLQLPEIVDRAKAAITSLIKNGLEKTANEFN